MYNIIIAVSTGYVLNSQGDNFCWPAAILA